MKKLNFYLSAPQHARLLAVSARLDLPMAECLRQAIEVWLAQRDPQMTDIEAMTLPELTTFVQDLAARYDAVAKRPLGGA
jgi:hypothetical protein